LEYDFVQVGEFFDVVLCGGLKRHKENTGFTQHKGHRLAKFSYMYRSILKRERREKRKREEKMGREKRRREREKRRVKRAMFQFV